MGQYHGRFALAAELYDGDVGFIEPQVQQRVVELALEFERPEP